MQSKPKTKKKKKNTVYTGASTCLNPSDIVHSLQGYLTVTLFLPYCWKQEIQQGN